MKITGASLLTVLLFAIVPDALAQPEEVVISGVSIVDVRTGRIERDRDVHILNGRIRAIGICLATTLQAKYVNGLGKFLIPGLWDMHVHALRNDRSDPFFKLFIANGVTGIRDMGTTEDAFAALPQLKNDIATGNILGPRIIAAGRILDGAKPAVPPNSIPFTGEAQAREAVRFLKRSGADFIKVYDGVSRAEYFAIFDEAKKLKIPVAGHTPMELTSAEVSNAGQKSIEHLGNILNSCSSLDREVIEQRVNSEVKSTGAGSIPSRIAARTRIELETFDQKKCGGLFALFVKNRTWQVPTLATKRPISLFDDGGLTSDPRMKYIPSAELEGWKPENNFLLKVRTPDFKVQKKRLYQKELELVRAMHRAGVLFMTGTDVPGAYTYPGFSLHDELQLFVENGFTPLQALRAATLNPAIYLGLQRDLGTIEIGKLADLVLLDENPLGNIANTKRINAVIANGRLYDRAKLDAMLEEVRAATTRK